LSATVKAIRVEKQERGIGMNPLSVQVMAGFTSSMIFVVGNMPMLFKVIKTKDMRSYSLGQIIMGNIGNSVYWLYVRSLPVGPVWFLQAFFSSVSAIMLFSYLRYEKKWFRAKRRNPQPQTNPAFANHPCGKSKNQLDE
jgi:uncharacterized protein with PQ loop repeat